MATVTLEGLSRTFPGGAMALRALDLTIADGEFLSLVGPSGCGKSTTLNLIAGLESPSGGSISIDGVDVTRRSPGERDVAMVFQSYALYPHLDVRGNLAFPLQIAGLGRAEIDGRVRETAALLGLDELLRRKPRELSGGQRQRVALGRALVRRPKVFLFDEPLSNLDASLRAQMRMEIKKLHERLQSTFIYVTHDQAEAMTLSDRVALLDRGALQQVGPPRELYDHPRSIFVARFFGAPAMSFVSPALLGLPTAPSTLVGLRPEDLRVSLEPRPPPALRGSIYLVEPMGAEAWVTVELDGTRVTARAPASFQARSGAAAWLEVASDRLHFFDAQSQERLRAPAAQE